MALEDLLQEEERRAEDDGEDHALGEKDISHHHAQALADQPNNQTVQEVLEKAGVAEVAQDERVKVALAESVRAEGEVVHVRKHFLGRPEQVHPIEEGVESYDSEADVSKRHPFCYAVNRTFEAIVEVAARDHPREQAASA